METVKPEDQVQLSEKELNEEHGRVLNAARPGPSRVILRYNLEERCYKPEPQLDQVLVHFTGEGNLLHREGEEGQALVKAYAAEDERLASTATQVPDSSLYAMNKLFDSCIPWKYGSLLVSPFFFPVQDSS